MNTLNMDAHYARQVEEQQEEETMMGQRDWRFDGGPGRPNQYISDDGWAFDADEYSEEIDIYLRGQFGVGSKNAATNEQLEEADRELMIAVDDGINRGDLIAGTRRAEEAI